MPQVVSTASKLRSILMLRQGGPARLVPGAPIGDGCQRAPLYAIEQVLRRLAVEQGEVVAEQSGEWGWAWHPPTFSLRTVLETATVAVRSFVGPLFPDVGPCRPKMKLAPLIARFSPGLASVVPDQFRQHDILAAKTYRFFGPQPAVVKHPEERD